MYWLVMLVYFFMGILWVIEFLLVGMDLEEMMCCYVVMLVVV